MFIGQFLSIVAVGGLIHENFHGGQQGAMAGEPDPFVRPQCVIIEVSDFSQSIEAPPMSVAGDINRAASVCERR
jgi:hypothetical protein